MSDLITGPGEYLQSNGQMAEIVGKDSWGNWHGVGWTDDGAWKSVAWTPSGSCITDPRCSLTVPELELDIPADLVQRVKEAWGGGMTPDGGIIASLRIAINWYRQENPPATDLTPEQWYEVEGVWWQESCGPWKSTQAAVRKALELVSGGRK